MLQNAVSLLISCLLLCFRFSFFTCVQAQEISYSCRDAHYVPLDRKIIERIGIRNGVFIEVGANDGVSQSNTKLLEECYGWTGILIEPARDAYQKLILNRPHSRCFQCALGSPEQENSYLYGDFDGGLMASIDGNRTRKPASHAVLMRTLQSILDEVGLSHIHFFSLDVEGYELNVLKGIDFNKTTFDYILIEIYDVFYDNIVEFMQLKGYQLIENLSNYTRETQPLWDGTHNDYLFQRMKTAT